MYNQALKVGFIGTGSMGSMLIRALLRAGQISPAQIWAANRTAAKLKSLKAEVDGLHCASADEVAAHVDILFLCIKPADTEAVLRQIGPRLRPDQLCVFLTNVFLFDQIEARIPCLVAKLIPTITQQVGRGVALLAYGSRIKKPNSKALGKILAPIGKLLVLPEPQLRVFADVASCGPALLSACIEELSQQAAKKVPGASLQDLRDTAIETLAATAELLRSGLNPEELINAVAVPGGMTEAGLRALQRYLPQAVLAVLDATAATEQSKRDAISLGSDQ